MREILFRGKRIDNCEWVEGAFVPENDVYPATIFYGPRCSIGEYVDPSTVGQYTGLTDKNGKRIFEGDIIRTERNGGRTYFVLFDDDLCAFIGSVCESNIFTTFEGDGDRYDVIGNIHDNPELLKEEPK